MKEMKNNDNRASVEQSSLGKGIYEEIGKERESKTQAFYTKPKLSLREIEKIRRGERLRDQRVMGERIDKEEKNRREVERSK